MDPDKDMVVLSQGGDMYQKVDPWKKVPNWSISFVILTLTTTYGKNIILFSLGKRNIHLFQVICVYLCLVINNMTHFKINSLNNCLFYFTKDYQVYQKALFKKKMLLVCWCYTKVLKNYVKGGWNCDILLIKVIYVSWLSMFLSR